MFDSRLSKPWLPIERIEAALHLEQAIFIVLVTLGAYGFYKFFLRNVNEERHYHLQGRLANVFRHLLIFLGLFLSYWAIQRFSPDGRFLVRLLPYLGLASILWGATVFIKATRLFALEYLFFGHMRVGVPLLLVNILSLVLFLILATWIATAVFGLDIGPLLATSAIFSVILGLALQEPLGNLFAGVALQLDKPYELGDWIEVQTGSQKISGRVDEITWRATHLVAITEEIITIPNRVIAAAQIFNFAARTRPLVRSQFYRFKHNEKIEPLRKTLVGVASQVRGIMFNPAPLTHITEVNENWVSIKLIYFVDDYGGQFTIASDLNAAVLQKLESLNIELASQRVTLINPS